MKKKKKEKVQSIEYFKTLGLLNYFKMGNWNYIKTSV